MNVDRLINLPEPPQFLTRRMGLSQVGHQMLGAMGARCWRTLAGPFGEGARRRGVNDTNPGRKWNQHSRLNLEGDRLYTFARLRKVFYRVV